MTWYCITHLKSNRVSSMLTEHCASKHTLVCGKSSEMDGKTIICPSFHEHLTNMHNKTLLMPITGYEKKKQICRFHPFLLV